MATAKKLKSGNWRVRVFVGVINGKNKYMSITAQGKKEAEYLAAEFMLKKKLKELPANLLLGEAFDKYIEDREAVLSPATIRGYKQIRRNRFMSIMNTKLSALRPNDIQKAVSEETKLVSPKTVKNAHGLLSSVLDVFLPDFSLNTILPKKMRFVANIPTHEDFIELLQMTEGTMMNAVIMLGACLGLRRSEMCALTWDDINPVANRVMITKVMVTDDDGNWSIKSTKTYAGTRGFGIPEFVTKKLMFLPRWPNTDRIIPITPNAVTDRFIRLRNRLKMNIRLHDLRHYNASVMLALGVPDKYAMERGGWATNQTMKNVYQHTFQGEHELVDNKVNGFFETLQGRVHVDTDDDKLLT
jgi:integrase